jgi:hypothetical protein
MVSNEHIIIREMSFRLPIKQLYPFKQSSGNLSYSFVCRTAGEKFGCIRKVLQPAISKQVSLVFPSLLKQILRWFKVAAACFACCPHNLISSKLSLFAVESIKLFSFNLHDWTLIQKIKITWPLSQAATSRCSDVFTPALQRGLNKTCRS